MTSKLFSVLGYYCPAQPYRQVPNLYESSFLPCGSSEDPDQAMKGCKSFRNVMYVFQTDWFQTLILSYYI